MKYSSPYLMIMEYRYNLWSYIYLLSPILNALSMFFCSSVLLYRIIYEDVFRNRVIKYKILVYL